VNHKLWLKSYDPEVPHSLSYPDNLIPSILENSARRFPDHNAMIFFGFSMTYQKLWKAVEQFSQALHGLGLREKQPAVLFLPNCPHFIIAYYAALRLGAIVVPANPLYNEKELVFQINDSRAETLITLDLLLPCVEKARSKTGLKRIIVGKVQDFLPPIKKIIYPILAQKETGNVTVEEKNGVFLFKTLLKKKFPSYNSPSITCEDTGLLQYTGGTTGVAKGAMLSHRNIVCNTLQIRHYYHIIREGQEVFISVLPFFHSYGMAVAMNMPLSIGATMIIFPKFTAKDILRAIQSYQATILPGIPSIYSVLNSHREIRKYDISTINYCISGAAPLPVAVLEEFEAKTGGMILEGYGLSESSPVTHCNPCKGRRKVGSIGLPVTDTLCKIVDIETGAEVPAGQEGELCIKGPQVMRGYWNREDETRLALRDGWLYTGDIARMDEGGYFYIVERKKDMIISEGFNIYPREIEEFLLEHPKVADAAVIGMPDKLRGEKVLAYITLKEGSAATSDEIIKYCRDNLVKYKVPKKVVFKDKIPTNIAGKKLRRILREDAEAK